MNFTIRPYKQGEEKYVADLHKALYSTEYSWGPSFTDYAMKIAADFAKAGKMTGKNCLSLIAMGL